MVFFFFSSRRRHTRLQGDWSSDVCSSDLRRLLEMGDVYRLSGGEKFRAIVIPSTLPYLVAGMKVGFGLALKVSVVAEIFGVTSGIGYVMNYSREILATQMVFVWALVMVLVMTVTDKLVFDTVSRRLTRWRP